eukprot:CAMPEP_0180123578 /NCGR_PEP_ID=MMETSP0986-20121125/4188_1 /TAXON_ID=697907 /ORGANISM="non described non described, Strain CCMP2293" /LENGTH=143 /DNA_ID=CAMNT_0022062851 /DNA_START=39 /DNA_END=472 /DNA_ORIENTATION=+
MKASYISLAVGAWASPPKRGHVYPPSSGHRWLASNSASSASRIASRMSPSSCSSSETYSDPVIERAVGPQLQLAGDVRDSLQSVPKDVEESDVVAPHRVPVSDEVGPAGRPPKEPLIVRRRIQKLQARDAPEADREKHPPRWV